MGGRGKDWSGRLVNISTENVLIENNTLTAGKTRSHCWHLGCILSRVPAISGCGLVRRNAYQGDVPIWSDDGVSRTSSLELCCASLNRSVLTGQALQLLDGALHAWVG